MHFKDTSLLNGNERYLIMPSKWSISALVATAILSATAGWLLKPTSPYHSLEIKSKNDTLIFIDPKKRFYSEFQFGKRAVDVSHYDSGMTVINWYESGLPKIVTQYNTQKKSHGSRIIYSVSGKINSIEVFKNGSLIDSISLDTVSFPTPFAPSSHYSR